MPQRVFHEAGLSEAEYALAMEVIGPACKHLRDQSALTIAAYVARLIRAGISDPEQLLQQTCEGLKAPPLQGLATT